MNQQFFTYKNIAKMIDHSLLNPALTTQELENGIRLAIDYDVASVCILPYYLNRCSQILKNTDVKPSTTIGFPHGCHKIETKIKEIEEALKDGAEELDMVVNISKVLSEDWLYVDNEIKSATKIIHNAKKKIKVIFENCYLNDEQKIKLCEICGESNVDWIKTSTGYGSGGATIQDVLLMKKHSPSNVKIKAAGGIRTFDKLLEFREIGVDRIGASKTQDILEEVKHRLGTCGV